MALEDFLARILKNEKRAAHESRVKAEAAAVRRRRPNVKRDDAKDITAVGRAIRRAGVPLSVREIAEATGHPPRGAAPPARLPRRAVRAHRLRLADEAVPLRFEGGGVMSVWVVDHCGPGKRDPWKKAARRRAAAGLWPSEFWGRLVKVAEERFVATAEGTMEAEMAPFMPAMTLQCLAMIGDMNERLYGRR